MLKLNVYSTHVVISCPQVDYNHMLNQQLRSACSCVDQGYPQIPCLSKINRYITQLKLVEYYDYKWYNV